jgi:glycyl-tRNA synthetase beta chain
VLLEGLIGSHYAESSGEDTAVVDAIRDQYRPRSPSDALPRAPMAKLLGIADRIDTVCGCFLAELIPSGSQDPYGLRRLSNGLMRILVEEPNIRLDQLIETAVAAYADQGFGEGRSGEEVVGTLKDFFASRCEGYLSEQGLPYDVVRAVGRVGWPRPGIALVRCRGIEDLRGDEAFERLITGIKRVGNILPKEKKIFGASWDDLLPAFLSSGSLRPDIQFSPEAFQESMETALLVSIRERVEEMADLDERGDHAGILRVLSTLGAPIDAYFEQVLVNCDDPALRINRIHFLACVFALFSRYADFSLIVEDPSRRS